MGVLEIIPVSKPVARWTIGATSSDGYDCLIRSIESFLQFYDFEVVITHNCDAKNLPTISPQITLLDQREIEVKGPAPVGVAWKLHPSRLCPERHELCIDNDIVLNERLVEIDQFLEQDAVLMLETIGRTYGRFDKHIHPAVHVNSGIYGMPPGFDLQKFIDFYGGENWEKNAFGDHDLNETFDEQGLVAFALSSYGKSVTIPASSVTNCEHFLVEGKGHHFIGLNRRQYHSAYRLFKSRSRKLY